MMGFALTIVYIVATIISPEQLGSEWASYHVMTYLAGITALASLPSMTTWSYWKRSTQTYLLTGFIVAIALSQVVHGWLGGVVESWRMFLPSAAVFFFIVVNVTTVRKLRFAALAAVASCLIITVEALCGYYAGYHGEMFVLVTNVSSAQDEVIGQLARIRGAGFLSDPNDLAQILLIALPLAFIAWRRRRIATNFFVVVLPVALLLWATYLTHSRGGLIALAAVALMAGRKKIGTTASTVLAVVFVLGMLALDFTGGRGISAADGADRLEAWANGLEMFKSAPLFGIGFNGFTDLYEITAHNSFVLCLAELGLLGSTLWMGLLVTTTIGLNRIIGVQKKRQPSRLLGLMALFESSAVTNPGAIALAPANSNGIFALKYECMSEALPALMNENIPGGETRDEPVDSPKVPQQWIAAMRLALVAFMATAWFLSRSYTTTMYLVLGLATATIALQQGERKPPDRGHWIFSTLTAEVLLILLIYLLVRLRH
ncbi:MAG TPA: O-antigen ligase family protein [Candidatus Acidoferrum sp.]|nr:O-antigen ligase family protein [Candidatus Acidoferrum sp.]